MRKYIFTPHERRLLQEFLRGNKLRGIDTLLNRIKNAEELNHDIELFIIIREKLAKKGDK